MREMATEVRTRRFSVSEFQRMGEAGILPPDERVELIQGEIITMAPIGSRHAACVERLKDLLISKLSGLELMVRVQNPVILSIKSQPQPDIAVVRYRSDRYEVRHPSADEILLIIEVSDSTLAFDRDKKSSDYGAAGVPETWVVDLEHRLLEVFRGPTPAGYETRLTFGEQELLLTSTLGISLFVREVFGERPA